MQLTWRIFTNCTSREAALKVGTKHFEKVGLPVEAILVEPYHKGGFQITAGTEHPTQSWEFFDLPPKKRSAENWRFLANLTP